MLAPRWRTATCWRRRWRACLIVVDALRAYEDRRRARARMLVRSSRRLNRVEQAQNPVACAARNLGMRCAPTRIADPAHDPSDAVRSGVDIMTLTEVRRSSARPNGGTGSPTRFASQCDCPRRVLGSHSRGSLERAAADLAAEHPLLRRLVEEAATMATPSDRGPSSVPHEDSLLPARYRGSRGIARLAAIGFADGLPALARPGQAQTGVNGGIRRGVGPRLIRRMLTSTQVDTLMRRCREEGVTIHGALAAAMAMVIGPAAAQRASGRICIGSPIDFRAELIPCGLGRRGRQLRGQRAVDSAFRWRP